MSRVLRRTQDGLVPGPCLLLSRWLSWAPDLGCVTFHESYTLQQKRLLKDPPVMPQVSDQQLSIPAPYPGASSRGSLESRVTPATRCLANTLPQSQRQVQGFHKVNTSPCHSALTGVFRSLSLLDAWGWYTGTTQRDGMVREVGGGFRMGNTCIPVADSF